MHEAKLKLLHLAAAVYFFRDGWPHHSCLIQATHDVSANPSNIILIKSFSLSAN
jgi:hypothetical protein